MSTLEQSIREKLIGFKEQGIPISNIAKCTGTQQSSLSRFVRGERSLTVSTLEKLWPFLYGDASPSSPESGDQE